MELWEILVPTLINEIPVKTKYHKEWDEKVYAITGGLTILQPAKGRWISPLGQLFSERMIPVRIACTREQISRIIDMTMIWYKQEAIMAYKVSEDVIIRNNPIPLPAKGNKINIEPIDRNKPNQNPLVLEIRQALDKLEADKGLYLDPSIDGIVMPCCGERYVFSYDNMKHLPKNPKLRYRKNGTIDYDPASADPKYVDYNGIREAIRQAKLKGLNHLHWRTCSATAERISKDGYTVHNDLLDTISW